MKGMNPELAKEAMLKIKSKKEELSSETKNANSELIECVNNAFAGKQTGAMQNYLNAINDSIQELYDFLDGDESNFSNTLSQIIGTYEESDTNVASSYDNAQ